MGHSVHNVNISKPLTLDCHTRGLRLWGRLDILQNSLKQHWSWFTGK
jgi:hypothetical protein